MALGILFSTLAMLGHQLVVGFASIALSRQREVATRLANEVMEQVRALPFNQLDMGNGDLSAATDTAILTATDAGGGLVYRFRGRDIPRAEITARPPLVPHTSVASIGPDATVYTRSVYVTKHPTDLDARLVTVRVNWDPPGRSGAKPVVEVESMIFESRCQAQEGPRPCESYWFASADGQGGTIRIRGSLADKSDVDASSKLAARNSLLVTEQLTTTRSSASTPVADLVVGSGGPTNVPGVASAAAADDSVSTALGSYDAPPGAGPSGAGLGTIDGESSPLDTATLELTVPSGSTAGTAAAAVGGGQVPPMGGGAIDSDLLGYGRAASDQGGTALATVRVRSTTGHDATTTLLSVASSAQRDTATVDRDGGTNPHVSDDDEVMATVGRTLGSVELFTLPSGALPGPAWTGSLARLTGWTASASANAGPNPSGAEAAVQTGTLTYWNGTGYTSVDLASGSLDTDVTAIAVVAGCTHEIQGHLQGGGRETTHENVGGVSTAPVSRSRGLVRSPLLGNFTYKVTCGALVLVDVTVDVDLGTTLAEARFAVPGA
jgi:hypothetical protein